VLFALIVGLKHRLIVKTNKDKKRISNKDLNITIISIFFMIKAYHT